MMSARKLIVIVVSKAVIRGRYWTAYIASVFRTRPQGGTSTRQWYSSNEVPGMLNYYFGIACLVHFVIEQSDEYVNSFDEKKRLSGFRARTIAPVIIILSKFDQP